MIELYIPSIEAVLQSEVDHWIKYHSSATDNTIQRCRKDWHTKNHIIITVIRGAVMYLGMCAVESGAWFRDVARLTRTSKTVIVYRIIIIITVAKLGTSLLRR